MCHRQLNISLLAIIWVIIAIATSCKQTNRFHIDSFQETVDVRLHRFDLDFIALDTADIDGSLVKLAESYPDFYPLFMSNILMLHPEDSINNAQQIKTFLSDSVFMEVNQKVIEETTNLTDTKADLSLAFNYLKHYFPDKDLFEIYLFISGFNQHFLLTDSIIAVGSDLYLGAEYEIYNAITHEYLMPNMRKEMLASDIIQHLLAEFFPYQGKAYVLGNMLYEGKLLFLKEIIMPKSSAAMLIGYSHEDLQWCKQYEKAIWSTVVEEKHLFSTSRLLINQFVHPAPFTSPVSTESPGRLGSWIGWQIIKSYMQNNPDISLQALMADNDYQTILEKSNYRP